MNPAFNRLNFFPGQLIDYRDFNRLSAQSDQLFSAVSSKLYEGGGIVLTSQKEFDVRPLEGLSLRLSPGTGLLPSGQPILLQQEMLLDLTPQISSAAAHLLIVGIRNRLIGQNHSIDLDDPSIQGFKSEAFIPELVYSIETAPKDTLEIFRVTLSQQTKNLRMMTREEEWKTESGESLQGVIDLRYRKTFLPQTHSPFETQELAVVRTGLYQIEQSLKKIKDLYWMEDPFSTLTYLIQLHAEILSKPFQPLKIAFLSAELADKLSQYLSRVTEKVEEHRSDYDRPLAYKIIALLDEIRIREVLPRELPLKKLITASRMLQELVQNSENKFNLLSTVQESLKDLKDRKIDLKDQINLAGHIFNRVDYLDITDQKRFSVQASSSHRRTVSARYANGDETQLCGSHIRQGCFSFTTKIDDAQQPAVFIFKQHIRRSGCKLHYEINGRHLTSESLLHTYGENQWINRGLVIPAEFLVTHENTFKIRVENSDVDFGFFDFTSYQPIQKGAL